ncbi:hypothetical protein CAPTEDRAFT_194793 [Capitella teleta]|uniref:Uncharacterized protein n=1 Tax=Capitella teleta TaxID=283909 RepID=R7UT57_CAPTE|nr:hypothetical protein CAPTEDRAFT_194793 [Capitella teleta]|eukprot:ELU09358.1 hypothetical protein CAPTEDRAFT_194793 [Capitella teleta]
MAIVGRQLAVIGDDINELYAPHFREATGVLEPNVLCSCITSAVKSFVRRRCHWLRECMTSSAPKVVHFLSEIVLRVQRTAEKLQEDLRQYYSQCSMQWQKSLNPKQIDIASSFMFAFLAGGTLPLETIKYYSPLIGGRKGETACTPRRRGGEMPRRVPPAFPGRAPAHRHAKKLGREMTLLTKTVTHLYRDVINHSLIKYWHATPGIHPHCENKQHLGSLFHVCERLSDADREGGEEEGGGARAYILYACNCGAPPPAPSGPLFGADKERGMKGGGGGEPASRTSKFVKGGNGACGLRAARLPRPLRSSPALCRSMSSDVIRSVFLQKAVCNHVERTTHVPMAGFVMVTVAMATFAAITFTVESGV